MLAGSRDHKYGICGVRGCEAHVHMCALHVIVKCAYPIMFCMVNAACTGVFCEVS